MAEGNDPTKPWEKYAKPPEAAATKPPWEKYGSTEADVAIEEQPGKPLAPSASTASPSTLAGGSGAAVSSAAGPTMIDQFGDRVAGEPTLKIPKQQEPLTGFEQGLQSALGITEEQFRANKVKAAENKAYYGDRFADLDLNGVAKVKEELATKRTTLDELRLKAEAQLKGFEKLKGQELSPEQQAFANSEIQNYNERVKAIQDLTTASDRDEQMALRREYDIKSQQGSFLGATHNFIQQGIGPLAALPISVLIDMTAQGLPASMLPASEEDINTKSRDQLAKEWKRSILPLVREAPMAAFGDAGTTPEYMQELEGSLFGGAWAGLARSAPAMVTPAMIGIFAQTTDGVMKEMEAPEYDYIPEAEKWTVAAPIGYVSQKLEQFGFRNLATNNAATKNILAQVLDKVPSNASKEQVERILNAETQSAAKNYLIRAAGGFVAEAETGGLQEIADVSIKDIYNKVKGTEVLNNPDTWGEFGADVLKASFQEGIGGFILSQPHAVSAALKDNKVGATANDRQFQILEAMMRDPNYDAAFKQFTESRVENGEITREQADEALRDWDTSKRIVARIPSDLDTKKRREAFDLLAKKQKLSQMEPELVRSKLDKIKEQLAELSNEPEPPKPTADGKTPEPRVATQEEVDGALTNVSDLDILGVRNLAPTVTTITGPSLPRATGPDMVDPTNGAVSGISVVTPPNGNQQPEDGSAEPTVGATGTGVAPVPPTTSTDTDTAPGVPNKGTSPTPVQPTAEAGVEPYITRNGKFRVTQDPKTGDVKAEPVAPFADTWDNIKDPKERKDEMRKELNRRAQARRTAMYEFGAERGVPIKLGPNATQKAKAKKEEREQEEKQILKKAESAPDAELGVFGMVLRAFASGSKVNQDSAASETGWRRPRAGQTIKFDKKSGTNKVVEDKPSQQEKEAAWALNKGGGQSVQAMAESMAANGPVDASGEPLFSEQDYRAAIIEVLNGGFRSTRDALMALQDMIPETQEEIIKRYELEQQQAAEEGVLPEDTDVAETRVGRLTKEEYDDVRENYEAYQKELTSQEDGVPTKEEGGSDRPAAQQAGDVPSAPGARQAPSPSKRDPELDRLSDAAKQARAERDRFLEDWNDRGTGLFAPEDNPSIQSSIDETIDNSKENFDAKLEPLNERVRQADKALADYVSKAADRAQAAAQQTSIDDAPGTSLADQIRKLKIDPNITGSFIIPPQLFNAAVEVVAKAIEAGVAVGKAIADGIRHIQQSDWYKGLTPSEQQRAEKQFTTPLAEFEKEQQRKAAPKAFNAVSDEIRGQFRLAARSAREAVGDLKSRQRQFAAQVTEVLKDLKGKVSPAQVSALVTRALKTNLDNPKAVAQYMNYAARVVADVNYAKDLVEAKVMRKRASKMSRRTTVPLNHRQALASIAAIDVTMIEDPKAYSDAVTDYLKTFAPESKGYQPGSSAAIIGMSERLQGQVDAAYRGMIADEHGVDETDGITPKQLYDALESDDIDAHSNSLSAAKAKALNDVLGRMAEYSKIGLREHDISDATPEQQKYVKDLLAVDIARLSPQQRKEYIRTVDNIVINDSFNGAARTAIMARNTQAMASALGTVANTPIPNVTLRKFRDTISSVSDVSTFLYGLSQTMAKIQERMGLGDFRRAKKKWSDEMKDVGKKMADFYTALHKKHKDIYRREALTAEGMVANAIQQVPGYDPIASFAIRKEIIEQDIAAKEEMRDHKKEAAIARVEFDELLKNAKTPEEAMAGLKARYPGNHKSIEFLKELFRPYKDALRQHTEDFWNEGGTWDDPNYLPVRYKNAPDQTIADPEDAPRSSDLAGSMYKPDRAAGTIARAPTLRLPKGRLLDYNVRHNAYRSMSRNLWDLNTSAPWEAIRQFLKMPEANKVFGSADNKSFVTQRMNRYMNRQFQNDPNDAMSNILNGMASGLRSWAAARALGGVLQLPKQLTDTVVNTTINLGGRFDRIVSMVPHIREAKGLLSKYPIGDRGNIEGGTRWEGRLMAHLDELEGAIEHGALSRIKAASKKIGHAWMFSLTAGDALGAKSSWMAYYEKARAEQGHKITSWKEESDLHDYDIERQEAGTFAETMTSRSQASSDASEMAPISQRGVSGWENMGKAIALPFSSFSMQALSRKAADLHNLGYAAKLLADGNKGGALARDPAASARSLTGTVLGGVAYAAISVWAVRAANEAAANAILQGIVGGADDDDEDKTMVRLATAVEVLYTMGLMDADVYRAISKAQRIALETTAQKKRREKDNRKAGQTEEQRQAVKKVREWKARVVTDLIVSGAQTTISNALIDNINRVEYYTLVANDDPSVMKAHRRGQPDEPVEFSYWQKNPSNTMLYRPGQGWDAGDVDLGMLDVVRQRGESLTNQAKLWYEYETKD